MSIQHIYQLACSTCANNFASEHGDAAGWAIMFMVIIVVPMLAMIGFFIYRIAQRHKKHFDPKYQDPSE